VKRVNKTYMRAALLGLAVLLLAAPAFAQIPPPEDSDALGVSSIFTRANEAIEPQNISSTMAIFLLLTVLTIAPSILVMTTSFFRIIVVLGFLRQAMATQQSPPNQVLIGLALILTYFIMAPTYQEVYDTASAPYRDGEIELEEAKINTMKPIREFMFQQVRPKDLASFIEIARIERPETKEDVPTHVLTIAFSMSELRKAFQIGFIIYIPFLIIDMVVASTLMSMGMMMLPPVFVSLPFKIIMFVLADGWYLLIHELVASFN